MGPGDVPPYAGLLVVPLGATTVCSSCSVPWVARYIAAGCSTAATQEALMHRSLVIVLVFVGWMGSTLALREQARGLAWAEASRWHSGPSSPASPTVPVRLVAPE